MIVEIRLNKIEQIKRFAKKVCYFESDINIIKGHICYDAKSIMAIFAMDTSVGTKVEIISNDDEEIKRFIEEMKEFQ